MAVASPLKPSFNSVDRRYRRNIDLSGHPAARQSPHSFKAECCRLCRSCTLRIRPNPSHHDRYAYSRSSRPSFPAGTRGTDVWTQAQAPAARYETGFISRAAYAYSGPVGSRRPAGRRRDRARPCIVIRRVIQSSSDTSRLARCPFSEITRERHPRHSMSLACVRARRFVFSRRCRAPRSGVGDVGSATFRELVTS